MSQVDPQLQQQQPPQQPFPDPHQQFTQDPVRNLYKKTGWSFRTIFLSLDNHSLHSEVVNLTSSNREMASTEMSTAPVPTDGRHFLGNRNTASEAKDFALNTISFSLFQR